MRRPFIYSFRLWTQESVSFHHGVHPIRIFISESSCAGQWCKGWHRFFLRHQNPNIHRCPLHPWLTCFSDSRKSNRINQFQWISGDASLRPVRLQCSDSRNDGINFTPERILSLFQLLFTNLNVILRIRSKTWFLIVDSWFLETWLLI